MAIFRDLLVDDVLHPLGVGREPRDGDLPYQRWLRATIERLRDGTRAVAIATDDERQFADRAVMEQVLAWAPTMDAVVLGPAWAGAVPRDKPPYQIWLENVHAAAAHEPYPVQGEQELAWARTAVRANVLEWEIEDVSLRRPRTAERLDGPYR